LFIVAVDITLRPTFSPCFGALGNIIHLETLNLISKLRLIVVVDDSDSDSLPVDES